MITVVMPSFFSSKLVRERILEINTNIQTIIIENSRDINLKKELEAKYENVEVVIPEENLGWGRAINLGIKKSKNEMVFITQPDVKLMDNCVSKLEDCINDAGSLLLDIGFLMKHTYKAKMTKIKQLLLRGEIKDDEVALIRGIISQARWKIKNKND